MIKNYILFFLFVPVIACSEQDDLDTDDVTEDIQEDEIGDNTIKTVKDFLKEGGYNLDSFYVGAALNYHQLNTQVENLFLNEFTYSTPENCAKQSYIHPEPNVWNWERFDSYISFSEKNNITVRIHGPISPQASRWAKNDSRTKNELLSNMTEYMTELSKKINVLPSVKWMDVVNETITRSGEWFGEKEGDDKWENPWKQIGLNEDGVPIYIEEAFQIADSLAPNISLVYNQHGGMEKVMWNKVKETILYLRNKGFRVDGLGWQAHLKDWNILSLNRESLEYLSDLIDWTHSNGMDFHITEIDYAIDEVPPSETSLIRQANGYANILKVLISKMENGVVTYGTWGVVDKIDHMGRDQSKFLFDKTYNIKPSLLLMRETLSKKNTNLVILD